MKKLLKNQVIGTLALSIAAILIAGTTAVGATYTWIGPDGGYWNDASNWLVDSTTSEDTTFIGTGGTVIIDSSGTGGIASPDNVVLDSGSVLELYGIRGSHSETSFKSITAGTGGGTFLLNGGWFTFYKNEYGDVPRGIMGPNVDVVVAGTESLLRAGHNGKPTIYGDLSGSGRLCTLSGYGTLYLEGSVTPGSIGVVDTLEISYNYDIGHSNACSKDFGADVLFNFDLGGTDNYDQLLISQGGWDLTIHDLDLDNFSFNYLDGFGEGIYVLIDDFYDRDSITGSLGTDLTRVVGDYQETLSMVDNDFILTVTAVPEPATISILAAGMLLAGKKRRSAA